MSDIGPKLLLIDGNNMSHRVFWAQLASSGGVQLQYGNRYTSVLFGFFRQLIFLRKKFPDHFLVVAWDGGYDRRKAESQAAVEAGIIPSAYKEHREKAKEEETDQKKLEDLESLRVQMEQLRDEVLPLVRCIQAYQKGVEGDDIIYTYCKYAQKWNGRAVVVSSDKDFYQVLGLGPEVSIFDAMKEETWTQERFKMEFTFHPSLWVDVGAFQGDKGDNIFGVDGWGPKTSCDYVRQYGGIHEIIKAVQAKSKHSKKEAAMLASIPKLELAWSLKKMDDIKHIPMPHCPVRDSQVLYKKFVELGFMSLLRDVKLLTQ